MSTRQQLLRDAAAFLSGRGMRPRAIVVAGTSGIGKTTFVDQLQVEILAAGRTDIIVVDDAHHLDADGVDALRSRLLQDTRSCLIVAHDGSNAGIGRMVDSTCERRVVDLPPFTAAEARDLLVELGLQPWTLHVRQAINDAGGVPREIIDRSFLPLDMGALPDADATWDGDLWSAGSARRLQLAFVEDGAELDSFMNQLRSTTADEAADMVERADAHATLSELALIEDDLEGAIQHGERATAMEGVPERIKIIASANASAARAMRGEPTAMLSLHALAGRASRAGLPVVESYVWYGIGCCAGVLGDVSTSERAAVRSIQLSDDAGAVLLALRARQVLADLHLAANRAAAARSYLEEIRTVSEGRGLHRLRINAITREARACIVLGELDDACRLADETLELVMRSSVSRMDVVDAAVIAARAYGAAGSVDLALAPIDALASELGDSHSPDFWLVLEAVRVLGRTGSDPAAFQRWLAMFTTFEADGHGGALRAAHAEVDAWRVAVDGRKAEAARLAERARQLWGAAECHDEIALTDVLVQQAPIEHGPRISLVGSTTPGAAPAEDPEAFEVLTKREREIARYVAGGLTNPEIASELHLSPRTVEHHVASILRKLELPSRRALVRGRV